MLSALGASERNLRVAMTTTGVMVGLVGSVTGMALGYGISRALQSRFEDWLGWRFRRWDLPFGLATLLLVMAVATAGISAWWPSRPISRLSIVSALAARRPVSKPATRSATAGVVFAIGGTVLLNWGVAAVSIIPAFVGLVLSLGGVLLLAPTFVRLIGTLSARLPLAARIAGRDLARHQTRSASALAATVLALGIPLGIVLSSSSAEAQLRAETPNVPPNLALLFQRDTGGRNEPPPVGFDEASLADSLQSIQRTVNGSQIGIPVVSIVGAYLLTSTKTEFEGNKKP